MDLVRRLWIGEEGRAYWKEIRGVREWKVFVGKMMQFYSRISHFLTETAKHAQIVWRDSAVDRASHDTRPA